MKANESVVPPEAAFIKGRLALGGSQLDRSQLDGSQLDDRLHAGTIVADRFYRLRVRSQREPVCDQAVERTRP